MEEILIYEIFIRYLYITELIKKNPDQNVLNFINEQEENHFYISVIIIGEILKGISKSHNLEKKDILTNWVFNDLMNRFNGRILDIDLSISFKWGELSGLFEKQGNKLPVIDSLLVSTCIIYDLIFVTRNISDVKVLNCKYINPWD